MKRFLVYFFGTDTGRVKMSYTTSNLYCVKRMIKSESQEPVKLLGVIRCKDKATMKMCRSALKDKFDLYKRLDGWYEHVPEISDFIAIFTESGEDILEADHQSSLERWREYERERRRKRHRSRSV